MPLSIYESGFTGTAGEQNMLIIPDGYRKNGTKRGIVLVHGAGELCDACWSGGGKANETALYAAIASQYPCITFDAGSWNTNNTVDSNNWGNTHAQAAFTAAISRLQSPTGGGAKLGYVLVFGISMGHVLSLNYAQNSGVLAAPAAPTAAASGSGSTLTAGTKGYKITYRTGFPTAASETAASAEVTVVVTAGQNAVLTMPAQVAGVQDIRIYGRTSGGAWLYMATIAGNVTTWTDDGSIVPAGAIPAAASVQRVGCIASILPVNDLDDIRDNNRGSYRASISNAWGTGAWTSAGTPALPATANPAKAGGSNVTNIVPIPQKIWYASDDAICVPATATALVTACGANTVGVALGSVGGHSDTSIGVVPINDVLAFLAVHA